MKTVSEAAEFENTDSIRLQIVAERDHYTFYAGAENEEMKEIGRGSTQLLSTEVMKGTFTGCFFALFAEGDTEAHFPYFRISESDGQKEKNRAEAAREYPV